MLQKLLFGSNCFLVLVLHQPTGPTGVDVGYGVTIVTMLCVVGVDIIGIVDNNSEIVMTMLFACKDNVSHCYCHNVLVVFCLFGTMLDCCWLLMLMVSLL